MKKSEWKELKILALSGKEKSVRAQELIAKTECVDRHPENYDGPCFCAECRSYGD